MRPDVGGDDHQLSRLPIIVEVAGNGVNLISDRIAGGQLVLAFGKRIDGGGKINIVRAELRKTGNVTSGCR